MTIKTWLFRKFSPLLGSIGFRCLRAWYKGNKAQRGVIVRLQQNHANDCVNIADWTYGSDKILHQMCESLLFDENESLHDIFWLEAANKGIDLEMTEDGPKPNM